jgi:hypothetical protein
MIRSTEPDAPIPPRLTEADREAHLDFITPLGEKPTWNNIYNNVEDIVTQFPGPITLVPSRMKWWTLAGASASVASVSTFAIIYSLFHLHGDTRADAEITLRWATFCAILFGCGFVVSALNLRTGASFLRLDARGFTTASPFLGKRVFRWSDVSDFDALYYEKYSYSTVVFRTATPRRGILVNINTVLARGRNEWLPDTYGFEASDLVWLMTTWQNSATAKRT